MIKQSGPVFLIVSTGSLKYHKSLKLQLVSRNEHYYLRTKSNYCYETSTDPSRWYNSKRLLIPNSEEPRNSDQIFINFFIRPNHWVLLFFETDESKVTCFDSEARMKKENLKMVKESADDFTHFFFNKRGWNFERNISRIQPSGRHCGVYNMLRLRQKLGQPGTTIPTDEENILKCRYDLAIEILEEKIA